jgi:hypothetical protein
MKVTQILKQRGRGVYTLGLKLIFIYAEYSWPTLFASLMNFCIAKVLKSLKRVKAFYNWQGRMVLFYLKLPVLVKLLSKPKINRVNLWSPEDHKRESLLKAFTRIESVKLEYG